MNPIIHDWHDPRNPGCSQNAHWTCDCTCEKPKRQRKPYRTVKVHDESVSMHKVRPDIILEIHPNGRLVLREKGRRSSLYTTVASVYERLVIGEARKKKLTSKK